MTQSKKHQSLDTLAFLNIRKWYLIAFAFIAIFVIIHQISLQSSLRLQLIDFGAIKEYRQQITHSQKLIREVFVLKTAKTTKVQDSAISALKNTIDIWEDSAKNLKAKILKQRLSVENDEGLLSLSMQIDSHRLAMIHAVEDILSVNIDEPQSTEINESIKELLENELLFSKLSNKLVADYDFYFEEELRQLKRKEYFLFTILFCLLILEVVFIFRPLSIRINNAIKRLISGQEKSEEATKEFKELYKEKEKSFEELQELNFVIDNAALFASTKSDGSIVFMSNKFLKLLEISKNELHLPLSEVLTVDERRQQYLKNIFKIKRKNIHSEEIHVKTISGKDLWLDMSIIPMHQTSLKQSIFILCSDVTERKITQIKVNQLSKDRYEENIRRKQQLAGLIVEGQEEERKRIAKDIHDGIGQMLTALKFNIESINLSQKEKTVEKIAYLKQLTSDLIKGIRTATFNLTPPELSDHGIFPALQKMTYELAKLTGKNILLDNRANDNIRFNSLAETNLYRVAQEAVNNAIKYADSNYILLTVNFIDNILSIVIDDDGKGFNDAVFDELPKNNSEGGMGLFFMKERIGYINGRLFINSEIGKGTRVTINYQRKDIE